MTTKNGPGPTRRWVDGTPGKGLDAHLGEVFREVPNEEPLSPASLAAVGRRLARDRRRGTRWALFRQMPVVLAVLVGGAGVALGEWVRPGFWHLYGLRVFAAHEAEREAEVVHEPRAVVAPKPSAPAGRSPEEPRIAVDPPSAPVPSIVEAPSTIASPNGAPSRNIAPAPKLQAETPPEASPAIGSAASNARQSSIALESEALQKALAKLRRDHDARAALALLDDYQTQFPHGQLSVEAAVARVDAFLLLGRRSDALALLARLPLDQVGRPNELRLVRAELYAERDCGQALPDFDSVLAASVSAELAERALYGRAGCRFRVGDVAGGRGDLQTYLKRYPSGRFAEQVRARLASP